MKPTRLFSIIVVALTFLLTLAISPATAGGVKEIKPPPPIDSRIVIKAVDLKANTVTLKYMRDAKQPDHVYTVDGVTQLKVNNVTGTITQIKAGMVVDNYVERDNDTLDSLELSGYGGDLTPATAKPKPPAKPKPTTSTPPPAPAT